MAAVLAATTLFMSSCEQEPVQAQEPTLPAVQEMAFTTVIRVPLQARRGNTGEDGILNPSVLEAENIAVLAPTFTAIWKDASSGKFKTYPIEEEFPEGVNETNFLAASMASMEEKGFILNVDGGMTGCLEVEFAGKARKGSSKMEAKWLRFVWSDPGDVLPDRNICQVKIQELKGYTVQTKTGTKSFIDYVNDRNYDGYPINVGTEKGMARVKTYEEARKMEVLTAQGELDQLSYYKAD